MFIAKAKATKTENANGSWTQRPTIVNVTMKGEELGKYLKICIYSILVTYNAFYSLAENLFKI